MVSIAQFTRDAIAFPVIRELSPLGKTLLAVGTYAVWTALTWVLEGRMQTFLRPDAVGDRLVYTGVANIVVGSILALLLVREFTASSFVSRARLGFRSVPRTLVAVGLGGGIGFVLFALQQPSTTDPVVVMNVFAQVLPVSIAEVIVCWVVVGGSVAALLRHRGWNTYIAHGFALVVSSILFGVYHFAHSPPFNSVEMVGLLTIVGVGTGLVYFVGRSFYGTLAFHNVMALTGIVSSLASTDQIGSYQQPLPPLLATALIAVLIVIGMERLFVQDGGNIASGDHRGREVGS